MASKLLSVALRKNILCRPIHLTAASKIYNYYPREVGPDPNVNLDFYESRFEPLPAFPRIIGFEGELKDLKEREKGDWKKLSDEDKMDLYNMYFSMSMAEMCRGTDEYKSVIGAVFIVLAFGMVMQYIFSEYVMPRPRPSSVDKDHIYAAIKRRIQLHSDPVTGYASMWDYENNCWKK